MSNKKALITGISGQDGSFLVEFLLDKGYEIHGMVRKSSSCKINQGINNNFRLHYGDLSDADSINRIVKESQPDEFYNLAAQSYVRNSFDDPELTADITGVGVLRCLKAIKTFKPECRFYQASSSEMFGIPHESPQNENTRFHPRSPYGVAKLYGHYISINYRESYNMHISSGIMFNHESPRRGDRFVTRKITKAASSIKLGLQDCLYLGNMYSRRDWGYALDFIKSMWMMVQQDEPNDYVIATGETHSIKEFVDIAFNLANMSLTWEGEGEREIGIEKKTGRVLVRIDPKYYRPAEVDLLLGDHSKAKEKLGWQPSVKFDELVEIMYRSDYDLLRNSSNISNVE